MREIKNTSLHTARYYEKIKGITDFIEGNLQDLVVYKSFSTLLDNTRGFLRAISNRQSAN